MRTSTKNISTNTSIVLTGIVIFGSVCSVHAQDEAPDEIRLSGIVRDFRERTVEGGHPDFEQRPAHGFGHYAGNISVTLGEDGKPVYTGAGYKVNAPWRDIDGRNIAPCMFNVGLDGEGGGVERPADPDPEFVSDILADSRGRDAFDISFVSVTYNDNGTSTWTYRVTEIDGGKDLSHWDLGLDESHEVMAGTTAGYDFGVDGSTGYFGIKWDVAESFDDQTFTIVLDKWYIGVDMEDGVLAKGGRDADLGDLFVPGTDFVESVGGGGGTDIPGVMGSDDGGGIQSAASFDQWYNDVPGVNMSKVLELTLVRQDDGSYVFDDKHDPLYDERGGFFPIDGDLFGNSGGSPDHNFHFTFELHTQFTHDEAAAHVFRFTGDDDVWVFINGQLVIDLGGVHGAIDQVVDLNRLGLEDGETYSLDFFFAERHRTQSNFRIATSMVLQTRSLPSVTAAFD